MSEKPLSTLGFERRFNRFLKIDDEQRFVDELTSDLAPQPPNFERIVELNRGPLLTESARLEALAPARARELLDAGATLIDGRATREFDAVHVPGSLNVTMVKAAVGTRAAWVVDPEDDLIVLAASDEEARRLGRMLEAVGLRRLRGYLAGGIAAWQDAGLEAGSTPAIDPAALAERLKADELVLLDVREDDEWRKGHVAGSFHVPYHELRDGADSKVEAALDGKPLAVACSAGNRSSIAVSLLARAGVDGLIHVADGGVADLSEYGVELVQGDD